MSTRIPGLAKPYVWIQPHGTDEILKRLFEAREYAVDERERENLCSVAHGEIIRLRTLIPDFHDDKIEVRRDMHVSTGPGDMDLAGRPLKPGR